MPASVLVLIPAHNEEDRIGAVIDAVRREQPDAAVLLVDDGSRDRTGLVARRHGATVIRHPFNLGYGAALQTGYLWARRHGVTRLVQMDADGQHDAASIRLLLAPLDRGADVVVGSRYRSTGDAPPTSRMRRIGSRLFGWVVTRWTGIEITDPTSGFQALSSRALEVVVLDHFPEDYPDADVLITLSRAGLKLSEVPVQMHARLGGVSMHRGSRAAYYGYKMLLNLSLLPIRRGSPFRDRRPATTATATGESNP